MKLAANKCTTGGMRYTLWCPDCNDTHTFYAGVPNQPSWDYNGNPERPTFTPSLITKTGHYTSRHKPGDMCWCNYEELYGSKAPFECYICHLFLTDGKIQFLPDCTHKLAGQTVELPDYPESNPHARRSI